MQWGGIIREAWRLTQQRALLGLSGVTVLSSLLFVLMALVVVALTGGLLLLVFVLSASSDPVFAEQVGSAVTDAQAAMSGFVVPLSVSAIVLALVWAGIAVLDVAAQAGLVAEVDRSTVGTTPDFARGIREGMQRWWRVAGLIAIAAAPGLVMVLLQAIVLFASVMSMNGGQDAEAGLALWMGASSLLQPVTLVVQVAAIPLLAVVSFALRFAVIDDVELRPSLVQGWRLLKAHVVDWLLGYLIMYGVAMAVGVVLGVVMVVVLIAGVALLIGASAATDLTVFVAGGVSLVAITVLLLCLIQWPFYLFSAAFWSLVWRTMTGRDVRFAAVKAGQGVEAAPEGV